jgi:hypothetical protein
MTGFAAFGRYALPRRVTLTAVRFKFGMIIKAVQ